MAITTYAELQAAVQAWFYGRDDITAYVPDFITLAEGHFNRELRVREMLTSVDLTPSSGVVSLPSDYLAVKRVVELANVRRVLDYIPAESAYSLYPTTTAGLACHFTVEGSSLYTYPLASNDIRLTYYQAIPALSDSNTSNWLLAKYPNIYLRGAQLMAAEYDKDDVEQSKLTGMLELLISQLRRNDDEAEMAVASYVPFEVMP